jgi:glucokinase
VNALGIDVGGTKIGAAVVDQQGRILDKRKLPVDRANTVAQIAALARELGTGRVDRVGVVIPGIYYAETGNAWAPNLWGHDPVPLRPKLARELPWPVTIDSDRAAYVLGEQWLGAAKGLQDVVFVGVGTGIGAGIISGGRLIRGAGDVAGAVGWFALNPRWLPIYKQMGCFEAEAAGPSLGRRSGTTTEAVVDAARRGEPDALRVVDETVLYLSMGLANIVSLLNPEMIVLGGGLMQAGDLFLDPIRRAVPQWAQPMAATQVRIELTQLGEDAGVLGAARLALLE